jgi:hypothetical protein
MRLKSKRSRRRGNRKIRSQLQTSRPHARRQSGSAGRISLGGLQANAEVPEIRWQQFSFPYELSVFSAFALREFPMLGPENSGSISKRFGAKITSQDQNESQYIRDHTTVPTKIQITELKQIKQIQVSCLDKSCIERQVQTCAEETKERKRKEYPNQSLALHLTDPLCLHHPQLLRTPHRHCPQ